MKLNYPIKYAAMPVRDSGRWGNNEVICYIVSKCFVVGEETVYDADGKEKQKCKVVFPYVQGEIDWEYNIPTYYDYSCNNYTTVDKVYDTKEEALKDKDYKNERLKKESWAYLPFAFDIKEQIEDKEREFNDNLAEFELLEAKIEENTEFLLNMPRKKLKRAISDKGISGTIYDVLALQAGQYLVYSVDDEAYDKNRGNIKELLKGAKLSVVFDGDYIYLINGMYIDRWNRLRNDDKIPELTEEKLGRIKGGASIYVTNESLEDIMESYKVREDIRISELKKEQNKKLGQKTL